MKIKVVFELWKYHEAVNCGKVAVGEFTNWANVVKGFFRGRGDSIQILEVIYLVLNWILKEQFTQNHYTH